MTPRSMLLLIAMLLWVACDRTSTPSLAPSPSPATSAQTSPLATPSPLPEAYLFHWRATGDLDGTERALRTTIYAQRGEDLEELGRIEQALIVAHQDGLSTVRPAPLGVEGCGACGEEDPVAACARDASLRTEFTQPRLLVSTPGTKEATSFEVASFKPSLEEPLASHRAFIEYHGMLGHHLFLSVHLTQHPCHAHGVDARVEHVVLDTRQAKPVDILSKQDLDAASKEIMVPAIGQAEAMYEGFDGELELEAAHYTLDGATPNTLYVYKAMCGEVCSGLVDEKIEVIVELPSAIVPEPYLARHAQPPSGLVAKLEAPEVDLRGQGWSKIKADERVAMAVQKLVNPSP